jgi:dihydrofolate reductase
VRGGIEAPTQSQTSRLNGAPGGSQLCRSFLQEDLVDELYLGLGPVLLGDGIPGFPAKFPQRDFKLTECKSYANGSVGLRYERMRTKTGRGR